MCSSDLFYFLVHKLALLATPHLGTTRRCQTGPGATLSSSWAARPSGRFNREHRELEREYPGDGEHGSGLALARLGGSTRNYTHASR